jgi:hypothetical protein
MIDASLISYNNMTSHDFATLLPFAFFLGVSLMFRSAMGVKPIAIGVSLDLYSLAIVVLTYSL